MRLWAYLFVAAGVLSAEQHPIVRLLPGSALVGGDGIDEEGEMVLSFRGEDGRVRETVQGRHWSLEYDVAGVDRDAIVEFFESQAGELESGRVLRRDDNRLTFRFRRSDGGTSWCELWATDGNYALDIVDAPAEVTPSDPEPEEAPDVASASELPELLASVAFELGSATLPRGAGALLDAVAARARAEPTRRFELRGSRSTDEPAELAERRGRAVADALQLYGVGSDRLDVTTRVAENVAGVDVLLLPE